MAKPTTYAIPICIAASILMIVGLILGFYFSNALIIILMILPAVIYEAYRTEGKSTRWASWTMLVILILESILLIFNINFDLSKIFDYGGSYFGGYFVPLSDLKVFGPTVLALLAVILFVRTYGVYTKWLAIIIFIGALTAVYILDPEILKSFMSNGINSSL